MKKVLILLILGILYSTNSFALSGSREKIEFQACYNGSINQGESRNFAKAYCKCFANKLDKKYTDKQLDKLSSKGSNHMMNKIRPLANQCYNSAKKKTKSSGIGSNTINLICYMNDPNSPLGSPHRLKIYPDRGYFELPEYRMKVTTLRKSSEVYSGTYEMGANVKWYLNRMTGAIDYVLSAPGYETRYHSGICKKTSGQQKF